MKVLQRKNYEHVFPMQIECRRVVDKYGFAYGNKADFCGSLLEVEAEDIVKHPWDKYPDFSGIDYGVKCPVCGKFIVIDKNDIPKSILESCKEVSVE